MKDYWNKLGVLAEFDTEYISIIKGDNDLYVKFLFRSGLRVSLTMFTDEPIDNTVNFSIYHDEDLIVSNNLPLDELVAALRNIERRIKEDTIKE